MTTETTTTRTSGLPKIFEIRSWVEVAWELFASLPASGYQLQSRCNKPVKWITRLLESLELKGLVTSRKPRRAKVFYLTAKGRDAMLVLGDALEMLGLVDSERRPSWQIMEHETREAQ
jgi:DNA-binding PadR family transcriptional regulator